MLKPYFVVVLFVAFLFTSCSKSSSSSPGSTTSFTATINGNAWAASSSSAIIGTDMSTGTQHISITGASLSGKPSSINLHIWGYTGTGTFPISFGSSYTATYGSGSQVNYATSGQIVITSTTGGVSGTFNFIADSMNVTAGTFTNVAYH